MNAVLKKITSQYDDAVKTSCFGGAFVMLVATAGIWAGAGEFNLSSVFWKIGLWYTLGLFVVIPVIYFYFRQSNLLWPFAIMGFLGMGIPGLSVMGPGAYFFYFGFAPMPLWAHVLGLVGGIGMSYYWGRLVWHDVMTALNNKAMFDRIYIEEDDAFYYLHSSVRTLEEVAPARDPFKSYHLYAALLITPFVVVLNRMLTPYTGSGHGVFIVLSFFGLPMMLFAMGVMVRSFIMMVYFPIKLRKTTGKPVLMRGFVE
jgi:hypothetical protein